MQAEHLYSTDDAVIADDLQVGGDIDLNGNLIGDDATDITNIESIYADHLRSDADGANNYMNLDDNDFSFIINGAEVLSVEDDQINAAKRIDAAGGINFGNSTMSHYEEGTWSPVLNASGTYQTTTTPRYIRVGDVVHIWANLLNINESGTQSSDLYITGLPFSPSFGAAIGTVMMHSITMTGGRGNLTLYTNGTGLYIYETISGAAWNPIEWSKITDNDDIYLCGTYSVQ